LNDRARFQARIVECFGRRAIVQLVSGERVPASVFGKRTEIVCGDLVKVETRSASDELQVVEVLPRKTAFTRTDSRGRTEHLASNLTLLVVVLAPEPTPDLYIADRYLAGAAYAGLNTLVVLNKADLVNEEQGWLSEYRAAGYRTLGISAAQGAGIEALRAAIAGEILLLVGQSGVGKSTLTNALLPALQRPTRTLSAASGEGRHTTVSSAWFDLPADIGGALIDSPGVRDYAPAPLTDAKVQVGWPEILSLAPRCRFNYCLHLREPGWAVCDAFNQNQLSARLYESYKRLLNITRQLKPSHERF
jgi:ribosome biogenesis GTPase / thiamine phosphate phosphatase